jgi:hypothetical protein
MGYLKTLHTLSAQISSAGGKIIVVTAESAEFTSETRKATGYEGLIIVDEKNELANELKRRGLVDVAISEKKGYENGMAQPAILGKPYFCAFGIYFYRNKEPRRCFMNFHDSYDCDPSGDNSYALCSVGVYIKLIPRQLDDKSTARGKCWRNGRLSRVR